MVCTNFTLQHSSSKNVKVKLLENLALYNITLLVYTRGNTHLQTTTHIRTQAHGHTGTRPHRHMGTQAHRHTGTHMHESIRMLVYV